MENKNNQNQEGQDKKRSNQNQQGGQQDQNYENNPQQRDFQPEKPVNWIDREQKRKDDEFEAFQRSSVNDE